MKKLIILENVMRELTHQEWGMCIGQRVLRNSVIYKLTGVSLYDNSILLRLSSKYSFFHVDTNNCKPILRTIGQLREDERLEFYKCKSAITEIDWLTQKGFDIRFWIEQGLAIKEGEE